MSTIFKWIYKTIDNGLVYSFEYSRHLKGSLYKKTSKLYFGNTEINVTFRNFIISIAIKFKILTIQPAHIMYIFYKKQSMYI